MSSGVSGMEGRAPRNRVKQDWLLVALFALPLGILLARGLALPAHVASALSLQGLPPDLRTAAETLLVVPVGAFVAVLFRLTLGIEVLGVLEPIMIAVALQVVGIPQGLAFLAAVLVLVSALRSPLRPVRADARLAVVLSLATGLVFALLATGVIPDEAWTRAIAFFPVIALCLACEGFSRVLNQEGLLEAIWRTLMTVLAACATLALANTATVIDLLFSYPELLLVQTGLIVLISRHFSIRLFGRLGFLARRTPSQHARAATRRNV
ncbi:MAG TPA: 7TM domain-containing protein [Usitatibacter sp.]|nr:7TM domain-containing protein [Usitatibacter sp.]